MDKKIIIAIIIGILIMVPIFFYKETPATYRIIRLNNVCKKATQDLDTDYCDKYEKYKGDYRYSHKSIVELDCSIPDEISTFSSLPNCYANIAKRLNDINVCSSLEDNEYRFACRDIFEESN